MKPTVSVLAACLVTCLVTAGCSSSDPADVATPTIAVSPDATVSPDSTVLPDSTVSPDASAATGTETASTLSPTTVSPTTLVGAASSEPSTAVRAGASLDTSGSCLGPVEPVGGDGEVTFVSAGKVWAVSPGASTARCLYDLGGSSINRLQWSPDSTAVLLGSDKVARGQTIRPSGYLPTNLDVNWSGPKGTSLLATTSKGQLVKRNSRTGLRTDISFLSEHHRSAYHPAGRFIASIGRAPNSDGGDDDYGIFLATNTGTDMRLLIDDASDAELSDLAFTGTGDELFFIARHLSDGKYTYHVHEYTMALGDLAIPADMSAEASQLTVGADAREVAVRSGSCDAGAPTDISYFDGTSRYLSLRADVPAVGGGWLSPVGWLSNRRLVYLARPDGCDGPGTLAVADLNSRKASTLVADVSMAATRTVHGIPKDLQIPIGLQVAA